MCNFCERAFRSSYDEDLVNADFLIEEQKNILGVSDICLEVIVDEYGNLCLAAMGADDYAVIGTRKIKFCPICGSEIPEFTSTYRHEHPVKGA